MLLVCDCEVGGIWYLPILPPRGNWGYLVSTNLILVDNPYQTIIIFRINLTDKDHFIQNCTKPYNFVTNVINLII